jgi:hypothetical protein
MNPITRRSVMAGSAAVMAAVPALALPVAASETSMERVQRLANELEAAMVEAYGVPVHKWVDFDGTQRSRPKVFLIPLT